ncbi:MAG: bifunctional diaminohydroxyphosphoribosylaminopyrimidine deaminase/5-amino-6-(5-phosphoribosylamino)uracil reductase RibD [Boseongicola sp.]|nr:MAG: bifunctional diaminohydroxyphosphoribosylaminopyrimidine deaminase/5-amino-6-(5-phosphoribosylamino)uracil reductase RibD [Boseongicola sp.]
MRHSLSLGARGLGRVWPNPAVGCVIVKDGRVIGRGRTADGGRPHAETVALQQAGGHANGATVYVTLEPCAHQGETPPCADALIEAGVSRVVIATGDPDPRVAGKGIAILQAAGIAVETDCLGEAARQQQTGFLTRVTKSRPMVTLKLASTLDGRIATASGESQWITGPQARRRVHAMRANHDAILVGAGTVRADDPSLNVRDLGISHYPVRVVASRHLRLPQDSKLFHTASDQPVWIVCDESSVETPEAQSWQKAGARLIPARPANGQISASEMLTELGKTGITRIFCEGGGMLAASLLMADLVDQLIVFGAGKVIGAEGQPSVGPLGVSELSTVPSFELQDCSTVGNDVLQIWSRTG